MSRIKIGARNFISVGESNIRMRLKKSASIAADARLTTIARACRSSRSSNPGSLAIISVTATLSNLRLQPIKS